MKKIMFSLVFIAVILSIMIFINQGFAQELPEVKWDLPHFCSPTYFMAKDLEQFVNDIRVKSNGKINIILHTGSSLLKGPETAPAVVAGRVPIGPILTPYVYDLFPKLNVTYLPFFTSSLQELRLVAGELRGDFNKMLEEKGLKPLFIYAWPTQQLFSNKPMDTVKRWAGKKVRIFNDQSADLCKRVKSVPVNIAFSELYTALQRGTVNAYITSNTNIPVMKFYEVSKFANQWTICGGGLEFLCVNIKAWNKLPEGYKNNILEIVEKTKIEDKMWADAAKADEVSIDEMKKRGMTIVQPSKAEIEKMREVARLIWNKWAKESQAEDLLKKAMEATSH
jgi:TRAP-type C4-dicarboxylate transport system substrate-binding protein